jgi:hypothetical protein
MTEPVRLIRHEESFEVRYADGKSSVYFYFDENPGRRSITGRLSESDALEQAKKLAVAERDRAKRGRG